MKRAPLCVLLLAFVPWACAQQPASPAPPKSISASLGLHAFPAKSQTSAQQQKDETDCYQWAKQDTGFDPLATQSGQQAPTTAAPSKTPKTTGAGAKGAAAGAAKGAVVGAVSGDAAKGAEVGAAAGAAGGRIKARRAQKQAEKKAKEQQEQTKEQGQQKLDSFKKGFTACMEAKGYVVK